ncbi:MAG: hypothetical protein AseanaTS_14640 [Candidatus Pelagadaptatus aseana]
MITGYGTDASGADTLGADPATIVEVTYDGVTYDTDSAEYDSASSSWIIPSDHGSLSIGQDGSYTYTSAEPLQVTTVNASGNTGGNWNSQGISYFGFADGDNDLFTTGAAIGGLDLSELNAAATSVVTDDSNGLAIDGSQERIQVNEHLVLELADEPNAVTVTLGSLGNSEAAAWHVYAQDGTYLDSGVLNGNSSQGGVFTIQPSAPDGFKYIVFTGIDSGDYFRVEGLSYQLIEPPVGINDEVFGYVLEDIDGDRSSADLTITHDLTISVADDTATVYEAGLANGTDAGNAAITYSGNLLDNDSGISASATITSITSDGNTDSSTADGVLTVTTEFGTITVYTQDGSGYRAGDYVYTLTDNSLDGDAAFDQVTYTVSDGVNSDSGNLTINIVDDAPNQVPDIEQSLAADGTLQTTNLILVLDVSGSMDTVLNGRSYLEIAVDALTQLIQRVDDIGNVNVQIVDFAASTNATPWYSDDINSAIDYLNTLDANGGTRYDAALNTVINNSGVQPAADQTLLYFVSDGEPNDGYGVDDTVSYNGQTGVAAWESYVQDNIDIAYGIGIGGAALDDLQDVAYPNTNADGEAEPYAQVIDDAEGLAGTLLDSFDNNLISGSFGFAGSQGTTGFLIGADDGYIASIQIDGTQYDYDPSGSDSVVITTQLGGELTINFVTGEYSYLLEVETEVLGQQEVFIATVTDNDGDTSDVTVRLNVDYTPGLDADRDVIVTNAATGDSLDISDKALLNNDSVTEQVSISNVAPAVGTDLTVGTDGLTLTDIADGEGFDYTLSNAAQSDTTGVTVEQVNSNKLTGNYRDEILINTRNAAGNNVVTATVNAGNTFAQTNQIGFRFDQAMAGMSILAITLDLQAGTDGNAIFDTAGDGSSAPQIGGSTSGINSSNVSFNAPDASSTLTVNFANGEFTQGDEFWFGVDTDNLGGNEGSDFGDAGVQVTITYSDGSSVSGVYVTNADGSSSVVIDDQVIIDGGAGDDTLIGSAANETLIGGEGDDLLIGGAGDDSMSGGTGSDEFLWIREDYDQALQAASVEQDTISDFTLGLGGDVLNIGDLLPDDIEQDDLADYLTFASDGNGGTVVTVDADGTGTDASALQINLTDVDFGSYADQAAIINQLLDDGNLNVD